MFHEKLCSTVKFIMAITISNYLCKAKIIGFIFLLFVMGEANECIYTTMVIVDYRSILIEISAQPTTAFKASI